MSNFHLHNNFFLVLVYSIRIWYLADPMVDQKLPIYYTIGFFFTLFTEQNENLNKENRATKMKKPKTKLPKFVMSQADIIKPVPVGSYF